MLKMDLIIILLCSVISAGFYVTLEEIIMNYGKNTNVNILLRFLPVLAIQFGMSCLGVLIVKIKNKEKIKDYGLVKKNAIKSIVGCLLFSIPTVIFLSYNHELHSFLPFQGMFLTKEILNSSFPMNIILYLLIALVWGFGEGFFYVFLSKKINSLVNSKKLINVGALVCAVIAILIHGMIGTSAKVILEACATFILMYGSICVKDKFNNSWGNVIWNAL